MCQYFSDEEIKECGKDKNFCGVCLMNLNDVNVEENCCGERRVYYEGDMNGKICIIGDI